MRNNLFVALVILLVGSCGSVLAQENYFYTDSTVAARVAYHALFFWPGISVETNSPNQRTFAGELRLTGFVQKSIAAQASVMRLIHFFQPVLQYGS